MEAQEKKPSSVRSIFVRSRSNEGIVVPLKDFPGQEWIRVRGLDSDVVQAALLKFRRDKVGDGAEKAQPFDDLDVIASMVSEWSFEEPITPELLRETLAEVPSLSVTVVNAGLERGNFLPQRSANSSSGQKSNSDSDPVGEDPNKPSDKP